MTLPAFLKGALLAEHLVPGEEGVRALTERLAWGLPVEQLSEKGMLTFLACPQAGPEHY